MEVRGQHHTHAALPPGKKRSTHGLGGWEGLRRTCPYLNQHKGGVVFYKSRR